MFQPLLTLLPQHPAPVCFGPRLPVEKTPGLSVQRGHLYLEPVVRALAWKPVVVSAREPVLGEPVPVPVLVVLAAVWLVVAVVPELE